MRDLGLTGSKTYQADARLAGAVFRLGGYPSTVFLNGEGEETGRYAGPIDWFDPKVRGTWLERLR
ncbi:hypothetical protein [uncultured Roseibium sp.]|uniref:TlpA family protein disulfide reductase n=1 Tax=uncultured Roseibium sp. TaxID=1936171 RepID=UPI00321623A3